MHLFQVLDSNKRWLNAALLPTNGIFNSMTGVSRNSIKSWLLQHRWRACNCSLKLGILLLQSALCSLKQSLSSNTRSHFSLPYSARRVLPVQQLQQSSRVFVLRKLYLNVGRMPMPSFSGAGARIMREAQPHRIFAYECRLIN